MELDYFLMKVKMKSSLSRGRSDRAIHRKINQLDSRDERVF